MRRFIFLFLLLQSLSVIATAHEKTEVADSVDLEYLPSFPGGNEAMSQFLFRNIRYPVYAEENGIQGDVVLEFVVEKDGSISEIRVDGDGDASLAQVSLRALQNMPQWTPGYYKGEPVRVRYNIPISFRIMKNNKGINTGCFIEEGYPSIKSVVVVPNDQNNKYHRVFRQKRKVVGFDNNSFYVTYYSGGNVYNARGTCIVRSNDSIISQRNSPACNTMLILYMRGGGHKYAAKVDIDSLTTNIIGFDNLNMTAICYRPDARQIAIARGDKQIFIINALNDTLLTKFTSFIIPQRMLFNDNGNILIVAGENNLEVWNMDNGTIRQSLTLKYKVNDVVFTDNCRKLLVATADGSLTVYETQQFTEITKVKGLGAAICCRAIGNGKYAAVLTSDKTVNIVNLLDTDDVTTLNIGYGGTTNIGTCIAVDGSSWIVYNSNIEGVYNAIGYSQVKGLKPYYSKMMENELVGELNLWTKKMPNEKFEAYMTRVNEQSRTQKAHEIALKITTRMANAVLDKPVMTFGIYNKETNQLALKIDKMPDIYIDVADDEIGTLVKQNKNVKLRNIKYMLNANDHFVIAYAEVQNPATNKVYIYDKMKNEPLALNHIEKNFIPIDIVMKTAMEETSLLNIKDDVVNSAKKKQVISDKTHISVITQTSRDVSADGKDIVNYDIKFTYEVDQKFSSRDDFKPGRFRTEESGAAMSMLKIMKKAFETDFAKYIKDGKKVRFSITGTADAAPILKGITYDGGYGEYKDEPVYKGNELTTLSLTSDKGITDNDQLAFARAIGVQQYLEKELTNFKNMKRDYDYHINVSKAEGSQYRRISVQCSFVDAF